MANEERRISVRDRSPRYQMSNWVAHLHTIFRAKLSLPRVTTVSSTRATPSIKAASLFIFMSYIDN